MKILISNLAHIGDVIMATSFLPALKSAYPDSTIGFVTGSAAHEIVEDHIFVDKTHIFNHPKFNRRIKHLGRRKKEGGRSFKRALEEIREENYDLAFETHYAYSHVNAGVLFFKSGIERRVGFSGSAPYYMNERHFWFNEDLHIVEEHKTLLKHFGLKNFDVEKAKPILRYRSDVSTPQLPENFLLIHMGSGDGRKLWSEEKWKELVKQLKMPLLFVGKGREEQMRIERVAPGHLNFCDKLKLRELMQVVAQAKMVVGLDSMIGHMAAAKNRPALLLYTGLFPIKKFRPFNTCCEVVSSAELTSEKIWQKWSEVV